MATGRQTSRVVKESGFAGRKSRVPAVTRAAAILRTLARSDGPLGVQAIARELSLIPSTCLHILRALQTEELVAFDPHTRRYRLDTGLLSLARSFLKRDNFPSLVEPTLEELAKQLGVTAIGLEVRDLDHLVVTTISRAPEPFQIHVDVGSRFPALISASGRCVAAFGGYSKAELRRRFAMVRWDRPPSYSQWRREVDAARQRGFAIDAGHYILGITVISAPIIRGGRVSHALVVVGLSERIRGKSADIGATLRRVAQETSNRMSG